MHAPALTAVGNPDHYGDGRCEFARPMAEQAGGAGEAMFPVGVLKIHPVSQMIYS